MTVPTFKLNNGVEMPAVSMGVWQGTSTPGSKGFEDAIRVGYRGFDTAKLYGNEAEVGKAVKASGLPRSDFFITTKLANGDHHRVAEAFQESVDQLDLEGPLDLWLMHWPQGRNSDGVVYEGPPHGPTFNETWTAMEQVYDTGRVRAIGVSNFSIRNLEKLLTTAQIVPAVNQVEGHPWLPDDELKAYCDRKGILLTYYSPLGSSLNGSISPLLSDPDLKDIADAHSVSVAQVALSWAVQRGVSVAPRSTSIERMKQNLALVTLTDAEMERIGKIHHDDARHTRLCNAPWNKDSQMAAGWTLEQLGWDVGYKLA